MVVQNTAVMISRDDISSCYTLWKEARERTATSLEKPIIVCIGDKGTGKSSIIQEIVGIASIDQVTKERMNINNHEDGTKDFVFVRGDLIDCIDSRGRRVGEPTAEFVTKLCNFAKHQASRPNPFDYFMVVLEADNIREDDIEAYAAITKEVSSKHEIPYIILLNKADQIKDHHRAERRIALCKKKFDYSRFWQFGKEVPVYAVSASPEAPAPLRCPNDDLDTLFSAHRVSVSPEHKGRLLLCQDCKLITASESYLGSEDFTERFKKQLSQFPELSQYCQMSVHTPAEGLQASDEAIAKILSTIEPSILCCTVKGLARTYEAKRQAGGPVIENFLAKVEQKHHAPVADKQLCAAIANIFDLHVTSILHGCNEKKRWAQEYKEGDNWFWQMFYNATDLKNYIASWGIFYFRKYSLVCQTMMEAYAEGATEETTFEVISWVLAQFQEREQKEISEFIVKSSRAAAYKSYLEVDASNTLGKFIDEVRVRLSKAMAID